MANIIKPKRSSTSSSAPTTSDLADGEIAVNTADQKIYMRSGSNIITVADVSSASGLSNVVEDTTPQLGGDLDLNSNNITGTGNISTTGNFTLTSTDTGSGAAPEIDLVRNSASPADADYLGQIKFTGENDADQSVLYAKITGKASDVTDTTEDGLIEYAVKKAGSNTIVSRLTGTALKLINGTGLEVAGNITVDGTVDGRDVATDGTKLDGIESNATADQTAAEILTAIKTVDGASSGLDADLLDGAEGSLYARLASPTFTGTPAAPTASTGTNTTQLATTAFVQQEITALKALLYAYDQS